MKIQKIQSIHETLVHNIVKNTVCRYNR